MSCGKALREAGERNRAVSIRFSAEFQEDGATYEVTLRQHFLKIKCLINADTACSEFIISSRQNRALLSFPVFVAWKNLLLKESLGFSCTGCFGHGLESRGGNSVSHHHPMPSI